MTLILLHGFTGAPESWSDVIAQLPIERPVFAPTLAGHGADPVPPVSFEREVERLCAIVRSISDSPVHLAGYSMGGRIALGMLDAQPELFSRASLIGARAGLSDDAEREERRSWGQRWIDRLQTDGLTAFIEEWQALPIWSSQATVSAERLERQHRIRSGHTAAGLASAMHALGLAGMPDLTPRLADIGIPVDLIVGERDEKFGRLADAMMDHLPHARRLTIDGAGHNLLLERPNAVADALNRRPDE